MNGFYGNHTVNEVISDKKLVEYCGQNKFKQHIWMWECPKCKCIYGPSTVSHLKRSNKCISCNKGEDNSKWTGYKEITGSFLFQYKNDAKKKNREWSLTPKFLWELWEKQEGKCKYTNLDLVHGKNASIDRIDSNKGYTEDNVQWVHRNINRMKSDFTEEYFVKMCRLVRSGRF